MSTEDRNGSSNEDSTLVAEFALGLLSADEHARVRRRLSEEPALALELRFWQHRLADLNADFLETSPPGAILERIEARLFPSPARGWWDSLPLWRGLAAGGLAAAIIGAGFALLQQRPLDPEAFATQLVAALESQEGSGVTFVALYNAHTGEVRLTSLAGEAVPGHDYELWYIRGGEPPVSMGVIPVAGRSEIEIRPEEQNKIEPGTVLAVTLEQTGGSPTGSPLGPVVAAGTATQI